MKARYGLLLVIVVVCGGLACSERRPPWNDRRTVDDNRELRQFATVRAEAERLIQQALLLELRNRAAISRSNERAAPVWLEQNDSAVRFLTGALCGRVILYHHHEVDVLTTPVEELLPIAHVDRATEVYCLGLSGPDGVWPSPAARLDTPP